MRHPFIYHSVHQDSWQAAQGIGHYAHPSLAVEGFIHCSLPPQLPGVFERYYAEAKEVLLLKIDPSKLTSKLQYDLSKSVGEEFPHIYGPLNLDAVVEEIRLDPREDLPSSVE